VTDDIYSVTEADEIGWPLHFVNGRADHYAGGKPATCPDCDPPSCVDCIGKHADYRSDFGHLDMDPETGATILVAHRR
jgi:hypothetical protein